ncbi:metallopeptidase [Candidatus Gottesmanbacteria bacterium]|nr:metallopeptidase [Candidatus Gottesmanbacteria bacterium]
MFSRKRHHRPLKPIAWTKSADIKKEIVNLVRALNLTHINPDDLHCVRSINSTTRAVARIWSLPRIWREILNLEPQYVIEVVSHYYDKLSEHEKKRTLIHELMHIPKNFSGSLISHRGRYHRIDRRTVDKLFQIYLANLEK